MEEKNVKELKAYVMRMEPMEEENPKTRAFVLVTAAGSLEVTWTSRMPVQYVKLGLAQALQFDLDALKSGSEKSIADGIEQYAHSSGEIAAFAMEKRVQPTAASHVLDALAEQVLDGRVKGIRGE